MIKLKDPKEVQIMAEGGKILAGILSRLEKKARPGITTLELDQEAEKEILAVGGEPSFKMVPNYNFSSCLCVNEVVVHGLPTDYKLKKGDLLGIDVGLFYKGFHTDMAWTMLVEAEDDEEAEILKKKRFLQTGKLALMRAIGEAKEGNRIGDISRVIQETIERAGYRVVRTLVGHGVGRKLHEDPQIPGFLTQAVEKTPLLTRGMTLAIEVIYNMGSSRVVYRNDVWTIATQDASLSALFEKTVAVAKEEPIVLTA